MGRIDARQTAYEEVTRNMVENMKDDLTDFKSEIRSEFNSLRVTNEHLYNHVSKRLPPWGTVIVSILSAMVAGFIGLGIGGSV